MFQEERAVGQFRYPDPKPIKLDQANNRLFLPKLGWLRYRNSREVLGTVKNVTVSQSCGKWFASIQTEREVEQPIPPGGALSVSTWVWAVCHAVGRHVLRAPYKVKCSHNWKKAKARFQRIHFRIANARRDFLHKVSTAISKNHAMQVRNLSESAAGIQNSQAETFGPSLI